MQVEDPISVAVLDIGTSNIRASAVSAEGKVCAEFRTRFATVSPTRGFVEFDAEDLFQNCQLLLGQLLAETNCAALAITNQRASTVVFDPAEKTPVAMGQSWQDLRTAPMCLVLKGSGISLSPNQSATKIALMMDLFDKDRNRNLFGGTIDAWIAFRLTGRYKTDHTNVAMTGLVESNATRYDPAVLSKLNISQDNLPQICPSIGHFGDATIDGKTLPLMVMLGDQQASMLGQGIIEPGRAKATFGTGAMVDVLVGGQAPESTKRLPQGTYPIVAMSHNDDILFGLEAIGLHAGSAVAFACDNLGLASTPRELEVLALESSVQADEIFVPALTGLATPYWDFGALACFTNLKFGSTKAELANAVLAGIAHQGTDLIESVQADANLAIDVVRVDGGMTENRLFLQKLADFSQRRLNISAGNECTTVGAGLAAHLAIGTISGLQEIEVLTESDVMIEPRASFSGTEQRAARDEWRKACELSRNSVPELSSVTF